MGPRLAVTLNVALVIGLLTAVGGTGFLYLKLDKIPRLELGDALDEAPGGNSAQNYLLVGTDNAARLDPNDPVTNGREDLDHPLGHDHGAAGRPRRAPGPAAEPPP